eukprot:5969087-Amphidinium_carterae.1
MDIEHSQTPPPPAGGIFACQAAGEVTLATIYTQLQTVLDGQTQMLRGYSALESQITTLGNKVDAHDARLEAVERQLQNSKQARSTSMPHASVPPTEQSPGKRPRSSPPGPNDTTRADDDRFQRTLVVNGWKENLSREELITHGRKLLQDAKDAMVVVRQKFDTRLLLVFPTKQIAESEFARLRDAEIFDGDVKLWVSKDKPAAFKRRDFILRSLKRHFIASFPVAADQVTQDYRGGSVYLGKQTVFFVRDHKVHKGRGWSESWDWSGFVDAAQELLCL